ncbi:MAG: hypothetical protein Q8R33_25240 [Burkholderiales bacterium]|nr:hypothetical protein [Burkholderiales bacterium]
MPMLQPRSLTTMPLSGASRLTFRRLRRPTHLPTMASSTPWSRCVAWLSQLVAR